MKPVIEVKKASITTIEAEAIVNPANSFGYMGGGVAGIIKRVGGRIIEEEAIEQAPIQVGQAVLTSSGDLVCGKVIHAPTMHNAGERTDSHKVLCAVRAALELADKTGFKTLAMPGMGTGVGGLDKPEAARIIIKAIKNIEFKSLKKIILVDVNDEMVDAFERAVKKMKSEYKLICLDADGVIFRGREFWIDAHKAFGTYEQGKRLTKKYLLNDYKKLEQEVVYKLWRGRDAKPFLELVKNRKYMKGVKELFELIKKKGWVSAIISGGSLAAVRRVQKDFGVDYVFANELIIKNGVVYGYNAVVGVGYEKKALIIKDLCKKLRVDLKQVIYIGDTDYDIEAFKIVGKAVAFNSKSEDLKEYADVIVNSNDLRDVLSYLDA